MYKIAKSDSDSLVRHSAIEKIQNQLYLEEVANFDRSPINRKLAFKRLKEIVGSSITQKYEENRKQYNSIYDLIDKGTLLEFSLAINAYMGFRFWKEEGIYLIDNHLKYHLAAVIFISPGIFGNKTNEDLALHILDNYLNDSDLDSYY